MKSLQLVSIKQERGSFEAKVANPEENTSVNINTDASWEKRESGFDGIIEVKVELVKLERILGEISGLFRLTYNWDCEYEAYPEEFVTRFLEQNIHFNAWPYMREFVQGCFQRMGWSPVVIPLLKQRVVMVK
ncbi:MAG: hypothetical protein KAR40_17200 [Candidatus Sabulitectum sp.]|nr:hypothetical protein [Candidatus Sabulitectum sp.]